MLQHEFTPLEIDEASLAFDAHEEVGHGGHFLGARTPWSASARASTGRCCPPRTNFERWTRNGAKDTAARAGEIYGKLEEYEQPPIDDAVREELEDYVIRRRAELGD